MLIKYLYILNAMRPLENHIFELLMLVIPLLWLWILLLSTNDENTRSKKRNS
jgi:hypothetical protein